MSDGIQATQARLGDLNGLALDGNGNLFLALERPSKIRKIGPDGVVTTVAGNGTLGFSGDGGQATAASLNDPQGIALDAAGNLYICDGGNHRIRKVDVNGVITTVAGTGVPGFAGDGGDALKAQLFYPSGIAVTSTGLLVADTGNARIRRIRTNHPPEQGDVTVSQNPVKVNTDVTFTTNATDADGDPLTYTWTSDAGVGGTGNPVTLRFPVEGTFTGTLAVSDGYETTTGTGTITVVAPPSTSAGVTNVSQILNQPPVTNPLNGITIQVASSDGGIVELAVDIQALIRADYEAYTDFSDVPGRGATAIRGPRPLHQFVQTGVFVASSNAMEVATSQSKGKARKTLAISRKETGQDQNVTGDPPSQQIKPKSLKGKFIFKSAKPTPAPDLVTFSGSIPLAPGLDMSKSQEVALGIGNITATTMVDPKGKGMVPGLEGRIKALKVKFPKLKGTTITAGGETAQFTVSLYMANMSAEGFDTEGVTAAATDLDPKGVAQRSIQIALVLAGVSYEVLAPVNFKLSAKKDVGQIMPTRSGF
jgi:hypothetical protein